MLLFGRLSAAVVPGRSQLDWHQRHALTITLLSAVVLNLGLSGYLAQLYGYLTIVQGMGPVQGGLALAPLFLAALLLARPAARVTIRTDERRLIVAGLGLMSAALLFTAALASPTMPYWPLIVPMGVFGFAFLVTQTAWNDAFLRVIPPNLIGASAGTSKAAAQSGTWLGTALLAAILLRFGQADFAQRLTAFGLSAEQITLATSVVDAALRADAPTGPPTDQATLVTLGLLNAYYASYTVGFTTALLWAAGICVAMAAGVWIVFRTPVSGGRRSPGQRVAQPSPTDAPKPRPDPAARSSTDP
jgi:DHA2 family multidrug resistance protein-like MFS transporter